jgi:hypothetical protein
MTAASPAPCYRLLYVSTARHFLSARELETLLQQSRGHNTAAGLTGMLVYVNGHFMQYVEGPQQPIEALALRLERDNRHHGLIRLIEGPAPQRIFTDWSMGFCCLDHHSGDETGSLEAKGLVRLAEQSLRGALPKTAPEEIVLFMESFYRNSLAPHAGDPSRV